MVIVTRHQVVVETIFWELSLDRSKMDPYTGHMFVDDTVVLVTIHYDNEEVKSDESELRVLRYRLLSSFP